MPILVTIRTPATRWGSVFVGGKLVIQRMNLGGLEFWSEMS